MGFDYLFFGFGETVLDGLVEVYLLFFGFGETKFYEKKDIYTYTMVCFFVLSRVPITMAPRNNNLALPFGWTQSTIKSESFRRFY